VPDVSEDRSTTEGVAVLMLTPRLILIRLLIERQRQLIADAWRQHYGDR
jgi:hypothetical protein